MNAITWSAHSPAPLARSARRRGVSPVIGATWAALVGFALAALDVPVVKMLALLVVVPALAEWVLQRGVQDLLRRRMNVEAWSIAVPALLFAAGHAVFEGQLWAAITIIPGLAISLLYARTRRLDAAIALHVAFNLAALAAWQWMIGAI